MTPIRKRHWMPDGGYIKEPFGHPNIREVFDARGRNIGNVIHGGRDVRDQWGVAQKHPVANYYTVVKYDTPEEAYEALKGIFDERSRVTPDLPKPTRKDTIST